MQKSIVAATFAAFAVAAPSAALMSQLPDAPAFPSDTYSGYLTVNSTKQLHYVFATSMSTTAATDPVVIWFNGGPGCSSMLGFMQENGPIIVDDGETQFKTNDYPWNQELNMLWIESPAGVGWSTATGADDMKQNDLLQSQDALAALKDWYVQYPEYLSNELFISGESYAGIYVPFLAWQVYINNQQVGSNPSAVQMNLQGFMVGNGATNWNFDVEPSFPQTVRWFNIIPPSLLNDFETNECHYYFYPEFDTTQQTATCDALWTKINDMTADLNWYDLYRPVYDTGIIAAQAELKANRYRTIMLDGREQTYKRGYTMHEYTPWAKHLRATEDPVILGDYLTDYMNQEATRAAFNIPAGVQTWEMCSETLQYAEQAEASEWIYQVLRYKVRKLFYSGDTDGSVTTYGSKRWIMNLNWDVTTAWNPWMTSEQVAGYVEKYDGMFDFVTVKGVGHMSPQWARKPVLQMINNFVKDQPY